MYIVLGHALWFDVDIYRRAWRRRRSKVEETDEVQKEEDKEHEDQDGQADQEKHDDEDFFSLVKGRGKLGGGTWDLCGGWRVRGCMCMCSAHGRGCEGEQGWEHFPGTDSFGLRWRAPRAPALRDGAEGTHAELVGCVRAQAALGAARHADLLARHRARPLGRLLLRLLAPLQVVVRGAASHRRDPVDVEVVVVKKV